MLGVVRRIPAEILSGGQFRARQNALIGARAATEQARATRDALQLLTARQAAKESHPSYVAKQLRG